MTKTTELCECPDVSLDHSAGRCPGSPSFIVERKGAVLHVCCNCTLSGDRYIETPYGEVTHEHRDGVPPAS
jgi:hypothetical protein